MSGPPNLCRECKGKFGLGNVCEVCSSLLRLDLYLKSPRCPGLLAPFVGGKLREAQRLILEEAESFWAAQAASEIPAGVTPKAVTPVAPGGAAGGVGRGAVAPEDRGRGSTEDTSRSDRPEDEFVEVKVEEPERHHRKSEKGEEKSKRKRRKHRGSESSGDRDRKKKAEPVEPSSRKKTRERSPEKQEELERKPRHRSGRREPEPRRAASPGGERSAPSSGSRRPRTPSHSPPREKWKGPIPAIKNKPRYWGKNKGIKKRESQVTWKKTWGGRRR